MSNEYYSHGKLLITGEYFVLEGSLAFAVPLKLGQNMLVTYLDDKIRELIWETTIKKEFWFRAIYNLNSLEIKETSEFKTAFYIQKLLLIIKNKSEILCEKKLSIHINTNLEFPIEWGFGSSSSLISNLAYWVDIDPYKLLFEISKASGYDIACARSKNPVLYQIKPEPTITKINFYPEFLDNIYFVYLGKKQDSLTSIKQNWEKIKGMKKEVVKITEISQSIVQSKTLNEFENYIIDHESIISKSINEPTVKSRLFSDFNGTVKSLGAWGGDFVMVTYEGESADVVQYFKKKGLNIIFPYKKIVL